MSTVRAIFCRRHRPLSLAIRLVTWSSWSHVATILDDEPDTVVEAVWPHGVRRRSLSGLQAASTKFEIREFDCPDAKAAMDFARSQVGKPYDLVGAFGLWLHREWQDDSRWWCSELHEASLAAGGRQRFRTETHRITPQLCWMVS